MVWDRTYFWLEYTRNYAMCNYFDWRDEKEKMGMKLILMPILVLVFTNYFLTLTGVVGESAAPRSWLK